MKIKLSLITMALMVSSAAETYKLTVTSTHVDKNSIIVRNTDGEVIPSCTLPEILNEAKNACINPIPECTFPDVLNDAQDTCVNNLVKVDWIRLGSDSCNGMRQANFNPNVYFARSKSNIYNGSLEIPEGYHWVSKSEYTSLFNSSSIGSKNDAIRVYLNQCGLSGYPLSTVGASQSVFTFSDSGSQGMHSSNYERHGVTHQSYDASTGFSGYVLYKDR